MRRPQARSLARLDLEVDLILSLSKGEVVAQAAGPTPWFDWRTMRSRRWQPLPYFFTSPA